MKKFFQPLVKISALVVGTELRCIKKNFYSRSGLNLLEVMLASAILGGTIMLSYGMMSGVTRGMVGSQHSFQLNREHETIRNMLAGLRSKDVRGTVCLPHPYQRFNENTRLCEFTSPPGAVNSVDVQPSVVWPGVPTQAQLTAVQELATAVFSWSNQSEIKDGLIDPGLSRAYYDANVRQKFINAQCTQCHDGSRFFPNAALPDLVSGRNFAVYDDITSDSGLVSTVTVLKAPLATKAMFASRMGPKLLLSTLSFENLFARSKGIFHRVSFSVETAVSTGLGVVAYTRDYAIPTACPGPCDNLAFPYQSPIQDGEIVNGVSYSPACTVQCLGTTTVATGGKAGGSSTSCSSFRMVWSCKTVAANPVNFSNYELSSTQVEAGNRFRSVTSRGAVP